MTVFIIFILVAVRMVLAVFQFWEFELLWQFFIVFTTSRALGYSDVLTVFTILAGFPIFGRLVSFRSFWQAVFSDVVAVLSFWHWQFQVFERYEGLWQFWPSEIPLIENNTHFSVFPEKDKWSNPQSLLFGFKMSFNYGVA